MFFLSANFPEYSRAEWVNPWKSKNYPVDTGHKLNVHKTFRRRPGRLLNVICTFSLGPVSTGNKVLHGQVNFNDFEEVVCVYFCKMFARDIKFCESDWTPFFGLLQSKSMDWFLYDGTLAFNELMKNFILCAVMEKLMLWENFSWLTLTVIMHEIPYR